MKKYAIFAGILVSGLLFLSAQIPAHAALSDQVAKVEAYASDAANKVESAAGKVEAYAADAAITAEIKGKILAEKGLDSLDIKVETTNGAVTLRGQVKHEAQAGLAERIARDVKGVRAVINNISVMP